MSITCPAGWTSSPASLAWEPRCYLVPPERSISLFQCVNLCKEHGGAPACIGSVEENDFVTAELTSNDLWLGLYQNETGLGPAKGWGRCVTGDAPSFSNWYEGQPNDYAGFKQDCSWIDARSGQWHGLACDGGVHLDPLPWRLAELSCLCVHGNASAAFAIGVKALEATRGYNQRLLSTRTAIAFAAAIAIAMFPTLLLLGRAGWRRLRRHRVSCVGVDPPSQLTTVGSDSSIARRQRGISSGFRIRLRAARKSAAGRRLRVSFGMGQAGWALLVIGGMPADMLATGQSITAAVGSSRWWLVLNSLGYCLLLLALFPTDARAIRVVCVTALVVWSSLGLLFITATLSGNRPDEFGFPAAALFFISAALVLRARVIFLGRDCCDRRAMQPRPALRWLWTALRVLNLGYGVLNARVGIADYARGGDHYDHKATAALSATCLLIAALASPRNRGRLHRRLGRLGKRGSEAEEAAAVAALVGGHDSDAALERASKLLRCLPAGRLHATDLADSTTAPLAGPTLYERTEPAAMGEVTAFLSHSWSDEKEAPGAKHAVVSCWAKQRQDTTGAEPTLWLDKACIDQNDIQQSLACLPVFLAGCQTLLVVAGPTYCSRLWCVMELFTFARMGGELERVEIHLNAHPDEDQTEARRLLTEQFATFDAGEAQCFLASDREHLLAVIEAGFGDFHDFNRVARNLFAKRVLDISSTSMSTRLSVSRVSPL